MEGEKVGEAYSRIDGGRRGQSRWRMREFDGAQWILVQMEVQS